MLRVEPAGTFVLPATIDKHKPIGCRYKITTARGHFWLTVISVNWGRGYKPGEFKRNVLNVLEHVDGREYVVLLIQELDEADAAPEHKVFRQEMEPGTTLVEWFTREPIAVSPGAKVTHPRKEMTMNQGSEIGAPHGTGPRRFITSCVVEIEGVKIGFANQHPHRVDPDWSTKAKMIVQRARRRGVMVTRREVNRLLHLADIVFYGGDMNDPDYPKIHPRERVGIERGLDIIRWIKA